MNGEGDNRDLAKDLPDDLNLPERDPDRLPPFIRPAVDFTARIRATVHTKMLAAFLLIAVLLVSMGILSIVVIRQTNQRASDLIELQQLNDLARQGIYSVTAQSHFRAMAFLTKDTSYNDKIQTAKADFTQRLTDIAAIGGPGVQARVERMRSIDKRYSAAGTEVLALYDAGELKRAENLHISAEHTISHELEDELNALIASSEKRIDDASAALGSLHRFLMVAVGVFSGISLLIALALGAHWRGSRTAISRSRSRFRIATSSAASRSTSTGPAISSRRCTGSSRV